MKLTKPIQAHGQELESLTLREPTTEDAIDLGLPMLMVPTAEGTGIEIRNKVVAAYIQRLGGIPPSSVRQLAMADFSILTNQVMSFFGQAEEG
jgi:hypothetical protein